MGVVLCLGATFFFFFFHVVGQRVLQDRSGIVNINMRGADMC
jgi:hypothetical protein